MLTIRQRVHAFRWAYRLVTRKDYPAELDLIKISLSPDDVCFDIGAHSGTWSYPLSKIVGQTYAFEALPYYAEVLTSTLNLLGVRNVTVVNKAASDREEDTIGLIWRDPAGKRLTGFTHVAGETESKSQQLKVSAVSLDSFVKENRIEKRIAFIKCDVEGYECHVISGALQLISRCRPLIFAEAKDGWFRRYAKSSKDLFDTLSSRGYVSKVFLPDGTVAEITATSYSGIGDIFFCPET